MTSDQENSKDKPVFCAHCGTENEPGVYSCDRCGERIYLPDPLKPPPMGLVECQNCLASNESRAVYCVKCGESLTNAARISVVGGGDAARQAPHSQPGGIRLRHRDRESAARPAAAPEPERPGQRPQPEDSPRPDARTREPEREREQREFAREKTAEQERQKSESAEGVNDSGTRSGQLPQSARGWNTAAFLIGPIWGPANGVWIGVLGLLFLLIPSTVPTLGSLGIKFTLYLAYGAFLGIRGNDMAWRARRWGSLEQFKRVQQQWMLLALVVNLVLLFLIPILLRS